MKTTFVKKTGLQGRLWSFVFALKGIFYLLRREPNAKIHAVATIAVLVAGFIKGIVPQDWLWLSLAIALVWMAEAFNTAIELICDLVVGRDRNVLVGIIKDIAAGAALIATVFAVVIGYFVFIK